jgi:acetylornithine/succinyldiaminopimelate/putrescine aminotransferase
MQVKPKTSTLAGEEGLLALVAGPNVVRFTPSLIIPEQILMKVYSFETCFGTLAK